MAALLDDLAAIVGGDNLRTGDDAAPHLLDWRKRYLGSAAAVVLPATTAEVAAVVRRCATDGVAIVPQGGNTGLAGGATPDRSGRQIVLALPRMRRVRAVDPANQCMTVEAGCTLAEVQAAAARADRLFPLSLAAEGTCTIGGNLATNAGGTGVLRYGNTRELVLGIEVVLATGEVWDGLRALRKNNTGYDLKHLFIGSEGTLGVITAAVLKLYPLPRSRCTAVAAVATPADALALLLAAQSRAGASLTAFEIWSERCLSLVTRHFPECRSPFAAAHPWYVLLELSELDHAPQDRSTMQEILAEGMSACGVRDAVVASSAAQAAELWALREQISEAQAREGKNIKHDVSLPISSIPEFVGAIEARLAREFPGSRLICFGHLGDGNLHCNVSAPQGRDADEFLRHQEEINRLVHDEIAERNGSISAEHGIGQLRRGELARYKSPIEIEMMRAIKAALDPHDRMNPGKVLPET